MLCNTVTCEGAVRAGKAADLAAVSLAKAVISRIKARTLQESSDKQQQRWMT